MNLELALQIIPVQFGANEAEFAALAREGEKLDIGGYHWNAAQSIAHDGKPWQSGSVFAVDGIILYALIRYFKFQVVAEIGGFWGCSASWMAAAMRHNGGGKVYSIDSGRLGAEHGSRIPTSLRQYVELVNADGVQWMNSQPDNSLGLVFEDADHSAASSEQIAKAAQSKMTNGGVYVVHDAGHDRAMLGDGRTRVQVPEGAEIRKGLDASGIPYRVYLIEPGDCGLAIAKIEKPEADASPVKVIDKLEVTEISETPEGLQVGGFIKDGQRMTGVIARFGEPDASGNIIAPTAFQPATYVERQPTEAKPARKKPGRKPKAKSE